MFTQAKKGMNFFRALLTAAPFLGLCSPGTAEPAIHYAPAENLEHVDVALINSAKLEIDLAAYVLTDWPLTRADRGVKVRIYPVSVDILRKALRRATGHHKSAKGAIVEIFRAAQPSPPWAISQQRDDAHEQCQKREQNQYHPISWRWGICPQFNCAPPFCFDFSCCLRHRFAISARKRDSHQLEGISFGANCSDDLSE
jgi:hypothetical protein